jgi:hypothetical protein
MAAPDANLQPISILKDVNPECSHFTSAMLNADTNKHIRISVKGATFFNATSLMLVFHLKGFLRFSEYFTIINFYRNIGNPYTRKAFDSPFES